MAKGLFSAHRSRGSSGPYEATRRACGWALLAGASAAFFGLAYGALAGAVYHAAGDPAGPLDYAYGGMIFGLTGSLGFGPAVAVVIGARVSAPGKTKGVVVFGLLGGAVFGALAFLGLTEPGEPSRISLCWLSFGAAGGLLFGTLFAIVFKPDA